MRRLVSQYCPDQGELMDTTMDAIFGAANRMMVRWLSSPTTRPSAVLANEFAVIVARLLSVTVERREAAVRPEKFDKD